MNKKWQRIAAWTGLLGLTGAWLYLSWFRWADPITDFGRELYIPWRLNEGDVLYKSFLHPYGPLSSYFKAFLFHCFGTSLLTLVCVNFLLLVLLCVLIFFLFQKIGNFWTGYSALLIFLGVFAFGQYIIMGNYNYLCPYSHEIVHGLLLSFFAFYFLVRYLERPSALIFTAVIGLGAFVLLTKFEIFLGLSLSLLMTGIIYGFYRKPSRAMVWKWVKIIGVFILIALAVGVVLFFHSETFRAIQEAVLARYLRLGSIFQSPYYEHVSGFDNPALNVWLVFKSALGYVLVLFALAIVSGLVTRIQKREMRWVLIAFLSGMILAAPLIWTWSWLWLEFRGLPLFLVVMLIFLVRDLFKHPFSRKELVRKFLPITLAVFSLSLLFKMILNVHVWHYGFVLAMPGALLLGMLFVHYAPQWGKNKWYAPQIFRALALALIAAMILGHMKCSYNFYHRMNYKIGTGNDSFWAEDPNSNPGPAILEETLEWVEKSTKPIDTVVVIPDGCMINYLSRRKNPTPYLEFTPLRVWGEGDDRIINVLQKKKPDYIIILDMDMSQFGAKSFGNDYGKGIFQWITLNYGEVFNVRGASIIMKRRY